MWGDSHSLVEKSDRSDGVQWGSLERWPRGIRTVGSSKRDRKVFLIKWQPGITFNQSVKSFHDSDFYCFQTAYSTHRQWWKVDMGKMLRIASYKCAGWPFLQFRYNHIIPIIKTNDRTFSVLAWQIKKGQRRGQNEEMEHKKYEERSKDSKILNMKHSRVVSTHHTGSWVRWTLRDSHKAG